MSFLSFILALFVYPPFLHLKQRALFKVIIRKLALVDLFIDGKRNQSVLYVCSYFLPLILFGTQRLAHFDLDFSMQVPCSLVLYLKTMQDRY